MMDLNGQERGRLRCIPASLIDVYGKRIGAYAAFVYGALACKADENGEAAIPTSYLSEMLGISERQVFRALDILKSHGLIMHHRERNWNVYSLTLPNSHSTLPNSHSTLPNSHSTLPNSHSTLPNSQGPPAGNGSEICSLVPTVPDLSPVPDPKIPKIPNIKTYIQGECRGGNTPKTPRRVTTPMPDSPLAQEALKTSIVSKESWQPWLVEKGLTSMDIDAQWEDFVLAALAHDYRYSNWYSAFQKWLKSPYQHVRQRMPLVQRSYTGEDYAKAIAEDEAWRATR